MTWLLWLAGICIGVNAYILLRTLRRVRTHRYRPVDSDVSELPTVSICIPARNEERALSACLTRVLASDYQKLEIMVLDDSSSDSTSHIIKAFAQAGVRFVAGKPIENGWTGKNHALDTMAREASGSIIIFMDVDTRIQPTTVSTLVQHMVARQLEAMWVLPQRGDVPRWSVLLGHMRYYWEIMTSSSKRPVSSGSFWGVRRDVLLGTLDGFSPVKEYIQPEYPIAQWVQGRHAYEGVISTPALGVYYEKRWHSQTETGERTLYLMVRRTAVVVALVLATLLAWFNSFALIIYCLVAYDTSWLNTLALVAWLLMAVSWYIYVRQVWTKGALLGIALLPYTVVQEILLLILSVSRYKFGHVTWKGRRINASPSNQTFISIDQ